MRRGLISISCALILAGTVILRAMPQSVPVPSGAAPASAAGGQQPAQPPAAGQQPGAASPERAGLAVVVIDPAHGGPDPGARGSSGVAESDVVLGFARLLRNSLEAQGLRVILTRQGNENPTFDDRSKIANEQRQAIFITLHVSSTGPAGTVRVYSLPQVTASAVAARPVSVPLAGGRSGVIPWDQAQQGFLDSSRKLAELVQTQMAQRFRGSAEVPLTAPVRQLRTIAAPAVAIEVSSVAVPDRTPLDQMAPGLADGVARAVAAFRPIYEAGAK